MAEMKYICVHHFGGPSLNLRQLSDVHRRRWPDFPSKLRPDLYVGYNFIIWKDGSWVQARFIGEETAAQQGHNFDAISICLEGDFTDTRPTFAQQETLKRFCRLIVSGVLDPDWKMLSGTKINIPKENIVPHRVLQPNHTTCYGQTLPDNWARVISFPPDQVAPKDNVLPLQSEGPELDRLRKTVELLKKLIGLQTLLNKLKVGGVGGCASEVRG